VDVATLDHSVITPSNSQMREIKHLIHKMDKNQLKIEFSDGVISCIGNLFYFKYSDKVIISDIDGTVTKSDMRGHLYSSMHKDYTHQGCAKLFNHLVDSGYKFIYLTARPVSMVKETKRYIESINQHGYTMPKFPIITSPNKSSHAFIREVLIKEPHTFKINILTSISGLFEGYLAGGFGNRETDDISYKSVGIASKNIFRINSSSVIVNVETNKQYKTYDELLIDIDEYFPK
jgi:phosphatidate phosphatase LPIN